MAGLAPLTWPTSPTSLNSGRFKERSAKAFVRVKDWLSVIGPNGWLPELTVTPLTTIDWFFTVPLTDVDWSYLSWPTPAARPNTMKLLLATTRHAVVLIAVFRI